MTSGHERNYNEDEDTDSKEGSLMDIKMSQEEEDEIADALNDEPVKVEQNEDTIMAGKDREKL